jgi:hypothetical protein
MRWVGHVVRIGEERGCIGSWWGNRRKGDQWGDLGVDGWIILEMISRRWDVGIWTGLGWPRIEKLLFNSVSYIFLLLFMFCSVYSVPTVPTVTLLLPSLRFIRAFSSAVRQIPEYNWQRMGTASTLPN